MLPDDVPAILEDVPQLSPHGDVRRYWSGCRCLPCRLARSAYRLEAGRRGLAETHEARVYLRRLAKAGIGTWQVAKLTGVARQVVVDIRRGRQRLARPEVVGRLLACPAVKAGGAWVTSWWPKRHLSALLDEGYHAADLERRLGAPTIRVATVLAAPRVRLEQAQRIERLDRWLLHGDEALAECLSIFDQFETETIHG
jgi:hypothetical protein